MNLQRLRPSPAMVVALLALIVAAGGTAVAATKIGTNQLKNNAVTTKKIKKKAVTTNRLKAKAVTSGKIGPEAVKSGKIADSAVDGPKVADDSLNDSKISDYGVFGDSLTVVTATDGPTAAAAQAAAPENPLFSKGPLEIYAKCFRDTVGTTLYGEMYARTSEPFSILEGTDDLGGGPLATDFLNPATIESDRQLHAESTGPGSASYFGEGGMVAAPDGTALMMVTGIGVKYSPSAANGPYGPGNACVFQGAALG